MDPDRQPPPPGASVLRRWRVPALAVAAVASGAALGRAVVEQPRFLHIELSLPDVGILLGALALSVPILGRPALALVLLVGFVQLNLSQVLVRHHGLPSLLPLLALALLVGAWRRNPEGIRRLASLPLTVALALYALVLLASTAVARDVDLADERVIENGKAMLIYLLVAGLAFSAILIRRAVWTLVGSGALLGGIAVVQAATGTYGTEYGGLARIKQAHIYGSVFEPRVAGPLGDPNFFAQILLVPVPLALVLAATRGRPLPRVLAGTSLGLVVAAIVLTYSRGGALALGVVLLLSLFAARRLRGSHLVLGAGLAALLLLALPADFTRRLTTVEEFLPGEGEVLRPDSSFAKRRLLTSVAWRIFLDHPFSGVGAGNYTVYFDEGAEEVDAAVRAYDLAEERRFPHSLYLEAAAETGLVGLAALGAVIACAFVSLGQARALLREAGDPVSARLAGAIGIALVGYLVSSLFLHGHFQRYLWLLFGLTSALHLLAQAGRSGAPTPS